MRRRRATVATPGEWRVRRLAVANGPNIFQMLLILYTVPSPPSRFNSTHICVRHCWHNNSKSCACVDFHEIRKRVDDVYVTITIFTVGYNVATSGRCDLE